MRALILTSAVILWCGSQALPLREPNTQRDQVGSTFSFSIKMEPPHPMFSNPQVDPAPAPTSPPATPVPAPVAVPTTLPPTPAPTTLAPETKPPAPAPKKATPKKTKTTAGKNDPSSIFTSFLEDNFSNLEDLSLYSFGTNFGSR